MIFFFGVLLLLAMFGTAAPVALFYGSSARMESGETTPTLGRREWRAPADAAR